MAKYNPDDPDDIPWYPDDVVPYTDEEKAEHRADFLSLYTEHDIELNRAHDKIIRELIEIFIDVPEVEQLIELYQDAQKIPK